MSRRPTAFNLDEVRFEPEDIYPEAGSEENAALERGVSIAIQPLQRGRRWLGIFFAALGGLAALAIGLAIDNLIRDLFARNDWLGWLAVALAAVSAVALVVLAGREIAGILRLRQVTHIHDQATAAATADDRDAAVALVRSIDTLYRHRPETARGRAALTRHRGEIIDGRDLIGLAETEILLPLDDAARRMVLSSAKRVAVVTAISPRALVDLLFVGSEILRLIRRIATLYGGRPGTIGFLRLTRGTIAHLAVTGGIAAGDSLVQQILGHGVAAKLSARLGEGVVNGLLTARVGIAAMEVCRPLPFITGSPPRLSDVMAALRPLRAKTEQ
jgi:putative membrane protein